PSFLREMAGSHSAARDSITVAPISFVRSAILLTIFSVVAIALLHLFIPFHFLHIFQGGYVASFLFFVGIGMLLTLRHSLPTIRSFFTASTAASAAAAVVLLLLFGAWLEFTFYEAWLTPGRWLRLPLLVLILIPWHPAA